MSKAMAFALTGRCGLMFGATGIYAAFLYCGNLNEDVFAYRAPDGARFRQPWFLQAVESSAGAALGLAGVALSGRTEGLPLGLFAVSGVTQVFAKVLTSMSLARGLSFPVATLAKSAKMAPVMVGSLLLGGERYVLREYLQVAAIILGTMMVSMADGRGGGSPSSSVVGLVYVTLSLAFDGCTGGIQSKLKARCKELGKPQKPYDFMFWTNLFILGIAVPAAGCTGQVSGGLAFIAGDLRLARASASRPRFSLMVLGLAACSAVGQSFIFYTIALFGPLKVTAVTTTRKILSVLLSVFVNNHRVGPMGWLGILVGALGICGELVPRADGGGAPPTRGAGRTSGRPLQAPQAPPPDDIQMAVLA
mmetsp:Transcript_121570/g.344488  ORF Transcript_121570/g.344488 Transcript_121570/m.344488 type:complete len:363 (+) Transcript_121570:57-1145(+)